METNIPPLCSCSYLVYAPPKIGLSYKGKRIIVFFANLLGRWISEIFQPQQWMTLKGSYQCLLLAEFFSLFVVCIYMRMTVIWVCLFQHVTFLFLWRADPRNDGVMGPTQLMNGATLRSSSVRFFSVLYVKGQ